MELDRDINYIVSGLERSGTSMIMQILKAGELPVSFDESRKPDNNNPKGYYELEGGKVINKLMDGSFPIENFKGKVIKITAYGLKFLPPGNYKIIYSERNMEEILDSMEKMIGEEDHNREKTKETFEKLNNMIKKIIRERDDIDVLLVNYNNILVNPRDNIEQIKKFLGMPESSFEKMVSVVDSRLYRQRRK
ncbi:MAG: sulfotransferase domain-containing protein [Candidatus Heimdallarchaeaceae archaeon]